VVLAQTASFVPPPHTIANIAAILDQEKPDPAKANQRKADADAQPPAGAANAALVQFYCKRGQSARELVSDLFRRQATDPKLTRGEALRAAITGLLDGKGFTDDQGKTLFLPMAIRCSGRPIPSSATVVAAAEAGNRTGGGALSGSAPAIV
jgi:hypothetical protein